MQGDQAFVERVSPTVVESGRVIVKVIVCAIVSVLAILVVIWAVAAPLGSVGLPSLAKAVRSSKIVTAVDALMPDAAHAVYDKLRETLNTSGFPDVFGGLAPTHSRPVQAPDPDASYVRSSSRSGIDGGIAM